MDARPTPEQRELDDAAIRLAEKLGPTAVLSVVGLTTLLSLVVYPLLIGGMLRVMTRSRIAFAQGLVCS